MRHWGMRPACQQHFWLYVYSVRDSITLISFLNLCFYKYLKNNIVYKLRTSIQDLGECLNGS